MSLPRQSSSLAPSLAAGKSVAESSARFLPHADLVFTQDEAGIYLSFYCCDSGAYGLKPEHVIGQGLESGFSPISNDTYLSRIHYVLNTQVAQQFTYPFRCRETLLLFDLAVSPILVTEDHASQVVVVGHVLREISEQEAATFISELPPLQPSILLNRYQKLLTQVAWNIRRTLDLETIWQQTVDGLGEALGADCCLICPYKPGDKIAKGVAEYRKSDEVETLLNQVLEVSSHAYLEQAIRTARPVIFSADSSDQEDSSKTILAITTCYQDDPTALIIIYQPAQFLVLDEREVDLIQEFADQVGTGIAHASLFAESRDLAIELQQANDSLVQKHHELEEAHKQAEEASRLKSEFLANTSHELRTPLNAMIGFLKLVLDGMADDPEEQQEFIGEAHHSAVHLLNIINDILDIARIEAGKMQLEMNPVNLEDLLTDVENFTRTQAEQKSLIYEIRMPATHDSVLLYGNYQRLLQVLLNLVWNAVKFTPKGSITITAEIEERQKVGDDETNTGTVKLSVADTGIGVSLEDQDKLFQSFSQVDGSRTRRFGGSGLGLVISQKLVEAMGGVVNFFSMGEGLGSTVTFTVPLYQDPVIIDLSTD
ncbi:MAG: ATP-binding protein [Elainellaceae cyanobacterium]